MCNDCDYDAIRTLSEMAAVGPPLHVGENLLKRLWAMPIVTTFCTDRKRTHPAKNVASKKSRFGGHAATPGLTKNRKKYCGF